MSAFAVASLPAAPHPPIIARPRPCTAQLPHHVYFNVIHGPLPSSLASATLSVMIHADQVRGSVQCSQLYKQC